MLSLINSESLRSQGQIINLESRHSSREKLTPMKIKLNKRLSHLSSKLTSSSKEYQNKIALLKAKIKSMPYQLKVLRQSVKRKEDIIKALRAEVRLKTKVTNILLQ